MRRTPTSAIAAAALIGGYAVAAGTGSRPLGGVVLVAGGLCCTRIWARRDGPRTAAALTGVGLAAFVASHVLAPQIGAWPAVLSVSAVTAATAWVCSDAPASRRAALRA